MNEKNKEIFNRELAVAELMPAEKTQELYDFLRGEVSGNISDELKFEDDFLPHLDEKTAFRVIYVLQEYFRIIPDSQELCGECGQIYDSFSEGCYSRARNIHLCGGCTCEKDYESEG